MRLDVGGAHPKSPQYSCRQLGEGHMRSIDLSSSLIHRPSFGGLARGVAESPLALNLLAQASEEPWFNISAPLEAELWRAREGKLGSAPLGRRT